MEQKQKQKSFRILNKNKESIKLLMDNKEVVLSWEEFNRFFKIFGNRFAIFNEETKEDFAKVAYLMTESFMVVKTLKNAENQPDKAEESLNLLTLLGKNQTEIGELLDIPAFEVAILMQKKFSHFEEVLQKASVPKKSFKSKQTSSKGLATAIPARVPTMADLPGFEALRSIK